MLATSLFSTPFPVGHTFVAAPQFAKVVAVEENKFLVVLVCKVSRLSRPVGVFSVLGVFDKLCGELGSTKTKLVLFAQFLAVVSAIASGVVITISTHCNT